MNDGPVPAHTRVSVCLHTQLCMWGTVVKVDQDKCPFPTFFFLRKHITLCKMSSVCFKKKTKQTDISLCWQKLGCRESELLWSGKLCLPSYERHNVPDLTAISHRHNKSLCLISIITCTDTTVCPSVVSALSFYCVNMEGKLLEKHMTLIAWKI